VAIIGSNAPAVDVPARLVRPARLKPAIHPPGRRAIRGGLAGEIVRRGNCDGAGGAQLFASLTSRKIYSSAPGRKRRRAIGRFRPSMSCFELREKRLASRHGYRAASSRWRPSAAP